MVATEGTAVMMVLFYETEYEFTCQAASCNSGLADCVFQSAQQLPDPVSI
jgi:hypothetical protein